MMTLSPLLIVTTESFVLLYCSATRGEMFALNNPVPNLVITREIMKAPIAPFVSITPGKAEMIIII